MKTITYLLALAHTAIAGIVPLAWEPSPATDKIAHYLVSYTAAGTTTPQTFKVAPKTTVITAANPLGGLESGVWQLADTPNLSPGTYTFTVQAVTAAGLSSQPSNEVTGSVLPNTIQKFQIIIDLKGTVTLTPQ